MFYFHDRFDMLLGMDHLKTIKAQIDFANNKIVTPKTEIEINYLDLVKSEQPALNQPSQKIAPRAFSQIKVPVKNMKNGEGVIPYFKQGSLEIPECLVKVENGECYLGILNTDVKEITLTVKEPLPVEIIEFSEPPSKTPNLNLYDSRKYQLDLNKIRTDHMNAEERHKILNLVKEYKDVFHCDGNILSCTDKVSHQIRTTDEIPVYTRNYRYPEALKGEIDNQIKDMLAQGIIRPSSSPWNSPLWIVPKKLDHSNIQKYRIVIDYRSLNQKTISDKYPLPNITELLDQLGRSMYFSCLDLKSGFHQIPMHPDSIEKTAFSTGNGHYEMLRMPMGTKNSPATFQRLMDNVLRGLQ
ncbi:unnamed protein product, partial [Nesidiocoris tenuis]